MSGQERFRDELGRLQQYCQEIFDGWECESDRCQTVEEICSDVRSMVGRLFGIAEELNQPFNQGVTISEDDLSDSKTLFDSIQTFRRPTVYFDLLIFDEAIHELKRVVDESTDPHVIASAYNGLGHLYAKKKLFSSAIYYFNKVIEFYPGNSDGYYNLGAAWFNQGSFEEARTCFKQALWHHPEDWEACFHLGRTYEKLDEMENAIYYMSRAREVKYSQSLSTAVSG